MALTTRGSLKSHMGVKASSTVEDDRFDYLIRAVSTAVTQELGRSLGDMIAHVSKASPAVVTSLAHGFDTDDTVRITRCNVPAIDGTHTVTRIDVDNFSVDYDNSAGMEATYGWCTRQFVEYYEGNGTPYLQLRVQPVTSVTSVWEDQDAYFGSGSSPFASSDLLVSGTDYVTRTLAAGYPYRGTAAPTGELVRINTVWRQSRRTRRDLLVPMAVPGLGNIKVSYDAGLKDIPHDLELAVNQAVSEVRQMVMKAAQASGNISSESFEGYSVSYFDPNSVKQAIEGTGTIGKVLKKYKRWVW